MRMRGKVICVLLCILAIMLADGCGNGSGTGSRITNEGTGVGEVLKQGMAAADGVTGADDLQAADGAAGADDSQAADGAAGADDSQAADGAAGVGDTSAGNRQSGVDPGAPEPENEGGVQSNSKRKDGVDVDLTELSATMVYSEVYNMMVVPGDYIGKTIKMNGSFAQYHDQNTGKNYYACIVKDATACCSQGIEFQLTDDYTYPKDYPKEGDEICVTGTFTTYYEGANGYCTLKDAVLESN